MYVYIIEIKCLQNVSSRSVFVLLRVITTKNEGRAWLFYQAKSHHVRNWNCSKISSQKDVIYREKISEFIIDETLLKVGSELIWLWWIVTEPENRQILALLQKCKEKNFLAKGFYHIL